MLIYDCSGGGVQNDAYFPAFRSFDWFCGHSWARGLLYSGDGKDQVNEKNPRTSAKGLSRFQTR